jgi:hypothetical protein
MPALHKSCKKILPSPFINLREGIMANFDNPLNNLKIASPCPANWDKMYGNNKVRFCGECKLNVYNLSGMTKTEAETLLVETEGRLCVRYFRRADGTVLTQDCPVGWRALKKRVTNLAAAACTLVLGLMSAIMVTVPNRNEPLVGKLEPVMTPTPTPRFMMGNVAYTPSPTPMPMMGAVAPRPEKEVKGEFMLGEKYTPSNDDTEVINNAVRKLSKKKAS